MLKTIPRSVNQAYELGKYAIEFFNTSTPSHKVVERVKLFHTDSVMCGLSALALKANAPSVLKNEASSVAKKYRSTKLHAGYSKCFGSYDSVPAEKAIVANCSAVREWDSNGTVFGYNPNKPGHQAGEFGHNDFYPVVVAAAHQNTNIKGRDLINGFVLVDEIRGRLAEVFSLKSYKIDHVVHGAIASICTYGAMRGATAEQIEHAIGMFVAHYIPYRAIRAGHQLSDSKGASAAISTEAAIMCMHRAMNGFIGPKDIFRNPEAIFRLNEKTTGDSPFDIDLGTTGDDFSVMGMHFKLGLYEHQSAGALEGLLRIIQEKHAQISYDNIESIKIVAYEPAFGIIGDPHKKNPTTRQSADHSMVYIVSTLLNKALKFPFQTKSLQHLDDYWMEFMLTPNDYSQKALLDPQTRSLMEKITFEHGGKEYDAKYPDGIPTSIIITLKNGVSFDSGLIMYPSGHARNTECNLKKILQNKFKVLGSLALSPADLEAMLYKLENIDSLKSQDIYHLYSTTINYKNFSIDDPRYV